MVAVFISGLGSTLLTMDVWIDDRHWPFFSMQVQGDLASLFSPSSVPLSSVGSVLCGYSGCERALPESVTGMLATSGPGYIKPYWCASKMLPKLADDANAAKAVGGDRCYLSSPAPSSQIVPSNKAINLIDQHINFTATFMLQLGETIYCLKKKNLNEGSLVSTDASKDWGLEFETWLLLSVWLILHIFFCVHLSFLFPHPPDSSHSSDM